VPCQIPSKYPSNIFVLRPHTEGHKNLWDTDWLSNQQTNQLNSLDKAESFFQTPTGPQLLKKFPAYYGNREFITAFKTARQMSMSWARSIPATPSLPTLKGSF
jgi:hypothetical protein